MLIPQKLMLTLPALTPLPQSATDEADILPQPGRRQDTAIFASPIDEDDDIEEDEDALDDEEEEDEDDYEEDEDPEDVDDGIIIEDDEEDEDDDEDEDEDDFEDEDEDDNSDSFEKLRTVSIPPQLRCFPAVPRR